MRHETHERTSLSACVIFLLTSIISICISLLCSYQIPLFRLCDVGIWLLNLRLTVIISFYYLINILHFIKHILIRIATLRRIKQIEVFERLQSTHGIKSSPFATNEWRLYLAFKCRLRIVRVRILHIKSFSISAWNLMTIWFAQYLACNCINVWGKHRNHALYKDDRKNIIGIC